MWSKEQIGYHKEAAKRLDKIKNQTFKYIKNNINITEYDIQRFILKKFIEYNLKTDKDPPIVAFNENSATPEFYPSKNSKRLQKNTFILIDLWAKLKKENAPFADITWVAFYGKKIPKEIKKVFSLALKTRTETLSFIINKLEDGIMPTGKSIEQVAINLIKKAGYKNNIMHDLGHSIGIKQDHGPKPNWIYKKNKNRLHYNLAYTIEPGIYLKSKFGIRTEMDFYISNDNKLIITTNLQNKIVLL
jgi:Xaa-Pro dipeptidase